MKTKDISVQGVALRLYKMDAFTQERLVDIIAPVFASIISEMGGGLKGLQGIGHALQQSLQALPLQKRHALIFDLLLAPDYVKQVINGAEMPLIGKADKAQTVMNDNLADYADLLEVAYESLQFNLERFFTKGQDLARQLSGAQSAQAS